jgi:UDP-glucuronate 4-epimerase
MSTRALVTGCAGFIGSHLTESLLDDGVEVVGVDCFNDNYGRSSKLRNLERAQDWDSFEFIPLDLSRGDLRDVVDEVDTIFHLAAEPGVRASWGGRFEAYLRNNVMATHHLLDACRTWPAGNAFVYASSSSVYGQAERFPTDESAVPQPFSPYGVTKLAAEHLALSFHGNHGIRTVALRYFSVYGPRQRPDMAFTRFCRAIIEGEPIHVFGDGRQTRDFTYVGDVVSATRAAAATPEAEGGVFNIGGGSRTSLHDAIGALGEIAGAQIDVRYQPQEPGDVRDTAADTRAASRTLGFAPQVDLRSGLAEQFAWFTQDCARAPGR